MKYIVSALLMLAVLALACFGCACYISMEVDMTEACLNQAAEALAAGSARKAEEYLHAAAEYWESRVTRFGTILQHDSVDEVSREFERLKACAFTSDQDTLYQGCKELVSLLENIRDLQWPYLRNIL